MRDPRGGTMRLYVIVVKDKRTSQVPGGPSSCMPRSRTPARLWTPGRYGGVPVLPPAISTTSALATPCFGGSITRPARCPFLFSDRARLLARRRSAAPLARAARAAGPHPLPRAPRVDRPHRPWGRRADHRDSPAAARLESERVSTNRVRRSPFVLRSDAAQSGGSEAARFAGA